MKKYNASSGWFNYGSKHESIRHGLSAKGICTGRKIDYSTKRQRKDALIGAGVGLLAGGVIGAGIGAGAGYVVGGRKNKKPDYAISQKELDKIARKLYNIDYPEWERLYVKYGGTKELARHLWDKWKIDHHDDFLAEFGNMDKGNQKIVAKMLADKGIDYALTQQILQNPQFIGNYEQDTDKDGVPDKYDWDKDGDGIPNWEDDEGVFDIEQDIGESPFKANLDTAKDSDFDAVPDIKDMHPYNPTKSDWAKKGFNVGDKFHVDTDFEGERLVDDVKIYFKHGDKYAKKVLIYSPKLRANILVSKKDLKKINYAKPEIKGQQLRIRIMSPKSCTKRFGTQDVGKKGRLQRVSCIAKKNVWKTQSWRLNLKDYRNRNEAILDLNKIKNLSVKKRLQSMKEINRWFK